MDFSKQVILLKLIPFLLLHILAPGGYISNQIVEKPMPWNFRESPELWRNPNDGPPFSFLLFSFIKINWAIDRHCSITQSLSCEKKKCCDIRHLSFINMQLQVLYRSLRRPCPKSHKVQLLRSLELNIFKSWHWYFVSCLLKWNSWYYLMMMMMKLKISG